MQTLTTSHGKVLAYVASSDNDGTQRSKQILDSHQSMCGQGYIAKTKLANFQSHHFWSLSETEGKASGPGCTSAHSKHLLPRKHRQKGQLLKEISAFLRSAYPVCKKILTTHLHTYVRCCVKAETTSRFSTLRVNRIHFAGLQRVFK